MDEVGSERIECVEVEPAEQRQLLQEHWPLAPRATLHDRITAIIKTERRLDGNVPARQILAGQEPAMAVSRGAEHLLGSAKMVDRLGDKALVPGGAGAFDLALARTIAGFVEHPAVGRGECFVAE